MDLTEAFEEQCYRCYGKGKKYIGQDDEECEDCKGTGKQLTDLGEALLSFLRNHTTIAKKK